MEGHVADILKTRGPKLTQIKLEVTLNNVADRVILPETSVISKKRSLSLLLPPKLIKSKLLRQGNTVLCICFAIMKGAPQAE